MIRTLTLTLALSASAFALAGVPAYAQSAPQDTQQTDKSEEDWRKSQKKQGSDDILDKIFRNNKNTGVGNGYPDVPEYDAIESLPEESRRHLKKQRAKVIATSEPGAVSNPGYTPSEAAKSDPDLAEQEKQVWDGMVKDMQGGGTGAQPGQGQGGQPGQAGQAGGQGQQGQNSGQAGGQSGSSPVRGGSSTSVADILGQIKGMQGGGQQGQGQSPAQGRSQGQSQGQGQSQDGQAQQSGQAPQSGNNGPRGGSSTSVSDILGKIKGMKGVPNIPTIPKGIPGARNPFGQNPVTSPRGGSAPGTGHEGRAPRSVTPPGQGDTQGQAQKPSPANDAGQAPQSGSAQTGQNDAGQAQPANPAAQTPAQIQSPAPAVTQPSQQVMGPLERMKQEREQRDAGGQSSAYDFLKDSGKSE